MMMMMMMKQMKLGVIFSSLDRGRIKALAN